MRPQPLNHWISQLEYISLFPNLSDITLVRSTTQPLLFPTLISLSLTLSDITLVRSTTQPLLLPTLISLSLTLWYHSCKINHSTTSPPNSGLSPSLTLESLTTQPLHIPTHICLSLTLSNITCVRSTTQPNKCQMKIWTPVGWTQTQPFNHKYRSQLQSFLSLFKISTSQPHHLQT